MEKEYTENDIRIISAVEAVRLRPKLYFEKCFQSGNLDALPLELACHAIDEVLDKNCSVIEFTLFKDHFSIQYDAGMPLHKNQGTYKAELMMTAIFACKNHKKHLSVGDEFCELGIATINFASEYCSVKTISDGYIGSFDFKQGKLVHSKVQTIAITANSTEIILKPDPRIFEDLTFSFEGVKHKIDKLTERLKDVEVILNP